MYCAVIFLTLPIAKVSAFMGKFDKSLRIC